MSKKIGDNKSVGGVGSTGPTRNVEQTDSVAGISSVKTVASVGKVARSGVVQRSKLTRTMSASEREYLFRMINEEAEKLCSDGSISPKQREVVETAVKMAVDGALIEEEEEA